MASCMRALMQGKCTAPDTITGNILWSFESGGSVLGGPSIVNATDCGGAGYRKIAPGIGTNKVFAFSLAGSKDQGAGSNDQGVQKGWLALNKLISPSMFHVVV